MSPESTPSQESTTAPLTLNWVWQGIVTYLSTTGRIRQTIDFVLASIFYRFFFTLLGGLFATFWAGSREAAIVYIGSGFYLDGLKWIRARWRRTSLEVAIENDRQQTASLPLFEKYGRYYALTRGILYGAMIVFPLILWLIWQLMPGVYLDGLLSRLMTSFELLRDYNLPARQLFENLALEMEIRIENRLLLAQIDTLLFIGLTISIIHLAATPRSHFASLIMHYPLLQQQLKAGLPSGLNGALYNYKRAGPSSLFSLSLIVLLLLPFPAGLFTGRSVSLYSGGLILGPIFFFLSLAVVIALAYRILFIRFLIFRQVHILRAYCDRTGCDPARIPCDYLDDMAVGLPKPGDANGFGALRKQIWQWYLVYLNGFRGRLSRRAVSIRSTIAAIALRFFVTFTLFLIGINWARNSQILTLITGIGVAADLFRYVWSPVSEEMRRLPLLSPPFSEHTRYRQMRVRSLSWGVFSLVIFYFAGLVLAARLLPPSLLYSYLNAFAPVNQLAQYVGPAIQLTSAPEWVWPDAPYLGHLLFYHIWTLGLFALGVAIGLLSLCGDPSLPDPWGEWYVGMAHAETKLRGTRFITWPLGKGYLFPTMLLCAFAVWAYSFLPQLLIIYGFALSFLSLMFLFYGLQLLYFMLFRAWREAAITGALERDPAALLLANPLQKE